MTDPTPDAAKLLPCPWCATPPLGSPLNNALEPKRSMYLLQCPSGKCPVRPKVYGSDQADAERRWNTRPQPAPREAGWRPIESAPKDGSPFLAFFPGDGQIEMVHWSAALDPANSGDDAWYVYRCEEGWPIIGEFTHWRPLPSPPAGKEGDR